MSADTIITALSTALILGTAFYFVFLRKVPTRAEMEYEAQQLKLEIDKIQNNGRQELREGVARLESGIATIHRSLSEINSGVVHLRESWARIDERVNTLEKKRNG